MAKLRRFRPFTGALIEAPELILKKTSVFSPVDDWAAEEANISPAAVIFEAARGCAQPLDPEALPALRASHDQAIQVLFEEVTIAKSCHLKYALSHGAFAGG
jgi:hypothetical protein